MRFINKLKEWWNQPSWENEVCEGYNQIAMKLAQKVYENAAKEQQANSEETNTEETSKKDDDVEEANYEEK